MDDLQKAAGLLIELAKMHIAEKVDALREIEIKKEVHALVEKLQQVN